MRSGKFQGIICPATPMGSWKVCTWCNPSAGTVRPWILSVPNLRNFCIQRVSQNDQNISKSWNLYTSSVHVFFFISPTRMLPHQTYHQWYFNLCILFIWLPIIPSFECCNLIIVLFNQISKTQDHPRSLLEKSNKEWILLSPDPYPFRILGNARSNWEVKKGKEDREELHKESSLGMVPHHKPFKQPRQLD